MIKLKSVSLWLFKCAISASILYYLFLKIPFGDVTNTLINTKIPFLLPAILLQIGMICINAFQMKILVLQQEMKLTTLMLIKINFITFFYKLFLPGELVAGVVRWRKLSKPDGMRAQALACIILARIVNIFTLAFLGIIFFSIERPYDNHYISTSLLIGFLASLLLFLSVTSTSFSLNIENIARKFSFLSIPEFLHKKILKVWCSIKKFYGTPLNRKFYILLLTVLFHFMQIFSLYFFMRSLNMNISIISIAWITAAIFFLQMLPISISGLGVREGAFVFLLKKYGVLGSDSLALSLLIFGTSIAFSFFGGIFEATEFFKQDKKRI